MPTITKDEPVIVVAAVGALLSYAGTALVAHGVITDTQASAGTQQLAPLLVSLVVFGIGALARRFVTPAGKVRDLLEQQGLMTEADWARLEALIEDRLGIELELPTGDEHPDAVAIGAPPGGMAAGAPSEHVAEHAALDGSAG